MSQLDILEVGLFCLKTPKVSKMSKMLIGFWAALAADTALPSHLGSARFKKDLPSTEHTIRVAGIRHGKQSGRRHLPGPGLVRQDQ